MKHKKILIVTSEFPPQPGGIGNHAFHLAKNLVENGFKVIVLADIRSNKGTEELDFDTQKCNFKVVRINREELIFKTYIKRIKVYLKLSKDSDIILASGKFPLWMVGNLFVKPKRIVIVHGTEVNFSGIKKRVTNKSLKAFDTIIAVSNYTKSLLPNLNNIEVINNGFELASKPVFTNKDSNKCHLITVGKVSERKGQINIIKALPEIFKEIPNIHYDIVGIPQDKVVLSKLAQNLGVLDRITFHGQVDDITKSKLLSQSDIFVMLSNITSSGDVEGFGIAILEANAFGIPAIGSNNSGISDAIKDGYSGVLVDPLVPKQLLKAIQDINNDYLNYSTQSRSWSERFSWDIIIKKYIDVF